MYLPGKSIKTYKQIFTVQDKHKEKPICLQREQRKLGTMMIEKGLWVADWQNGQWRILGILIGRTEKKAILGEWGEVHWERNIPSLKIL